MPFSHFFTCALIFITHTTRVHIYAHTNTHALIFYCVQSKKLIGKHGCHRKGMALSCLVSNSQLLCTAFLDCSVACWDIRVGVYIQPLFFPLDLHCFDVVHHLQRNVMLKAILHSSECCCSFSFVIAFFFITSLSLYICFAFLFVGAFRMSCQPRPCLAWLCWRRWRPSRTQFCAWRLV